MPTADRSRLIRESFLYAATIAEPRFRSGEFVWFPYAKAIADAIEKVAFGEIKRLMIMCPPRLGKSMLASRLGAAWLLIRDPSTRVVLASYGESLAKRLSGWTRGGTSWRWAGASTPRHGPWGRGTRTTGADSGPPAWAAP